MCWHWLPAAQLCLGEGQALLGGAVTPLPSSREALKPLCRKARGERKQGGKERGREINNKQKLAASLRSSRASSPAGAGARLWSRIPSRLSQQRGQGRKRGQTVPSAQGCLGRSEQAGISSSDVRLHPTGSFQLLLCQHLPCQSTPACPGHGSLSGAPRAGLALPPRLCRPV